MQTFFLREYERKRNLSDEYLFLDPDPVLWNHPHDTCGCTYATLFWYLISTTAGALRLTRYASCVIDRSMAVEIETGSYHALSTIEGNTVVEARHGVRPPISLSLQ